ncbi:uncharacterized protein PHACADRAFT_72830, partial [Phanerochaete carnosa HHB-10118-sp]
EVYASSLFPTNEGYALWYPEPHESGEVQIGDVGYIADGAFIRLFNVANDKELRIAGWPQKAFPNPEPLSNDAMLLDVRERPLMPGPYRSDGVVETSGNVHLNVTGPGGSGGGVDAGFTCQLSQGAVLILNSEAKKEAIRDNYRIRDYVLRHHGTWCNYVRDDRDGPRLVVSPENIILVRGWVKTSANWKATTFCNSKTRVHGSVDVEAGSYVSAGGDYSKSRSVSGLKLSRKGTAFASSTQVEDIGSENQCVFLSRYMMKYRLGLFPKLRAAAGYHQLPDDRDGRSGSA